MTILLCACLGLPLYAFVLYPLVLALLAPTRPAPQPVKGVTLLPSVSMLLSVYNEEAAITAKIENFLTLDYPPEKLELILVSDGSTDATETLAAPYLGGRIRLLRQEGRKGKTSALNLAASLSSNDILFFTDADTMLRPDCVQQLAAAFADPETGLAGGRSLYLDENGRENAGSLYRRYEEWIKEREGRLWGIVGADGAVYALRRELYAPLPPECINDLLHPVQAVLAGKKTVAAPTALATEAANDEDGGSELARQTRIMAQSWLIAMRYAPLLLRAGRWGFLWQFFSHKILRWLALPALGAAVIIALYLPGALASLTLAGTVAILLAAWLGAQSKGGRMGRLAWLFMVQGLAALLGLARLLKGERFVTWSPRGK